jgi:hypothetical protein
MLTLAAALAPCGTLAVVGAIANEKPCVGLLNVAVTFVVTVIVNVQVVVVPLHAVPDQPPKALPAAGAAVNVTDVPYANPLPHVLPQLMPPGADVTVPVPEPARVTLTCGRVTVTGN